MILLDKPYVSRFLKDTIREKGYKLINTDKVKQFGFGKEACLINEADAIERARQNGDELFYTNSENSIGWIKRNLKFTNIPDKIDTFKNKASLRRKLKPLYPNYFFKEVPLDKLDDLNKDEIPLPVVIKPSVGFFSMGVHNITDADQWLTLGKKLKEEIDEVRDIYPEEVFDSSSFLIEQLIEGDEFAIDAYFDKEGKPVILNITKHIFASGDDVSDRLYITSKEIIEENIDRMALFLENVGKVTKMNSFPVHAEVRVTDDGTVIPIEINPLRFGGWCTTADLAYYAFGFNPYEYYFSQIVPDWDKALDGREEKLYSLMLLDNTTGVDADKIKAFDYDKVLSLMENPFELRKVDWHEYPVFGLMFAETGKNNFAELERFLKSDLKEFVVLKT